MSHLLETNEKSCHSLSGHILNCSANCWRAACNWVGYCRIAGTLSLNRLGTEKKRIKQKDKIIKLLKRIEIIKKFETIERVAS